MWVNDKMGGVFIYSSTVFVWNNREKLNRIKRISPKSKFISVFILETNFHNFTVVLATLVSFYLPNMAALNSTQIQNIGPNTEDGNFLTSKYIFSFLKKNNSRPDYHVNVKIWTKNETSEIDLMVSKENT